MAKKLEKLKMPPKKDDMDLESMQSSDEGSPEEEDSESPDEESQEGDMPQDEGDSKPDPELAHVSDDELIAEIKKRGLISELEDSDQSGDSGGDEHGGPDMSSPEGPAY